MIKPISVVFIDRLVLPLEYRNHAILLGGKMIFNRKYYRSPNSIGWRYSHELNSIENHVKRLPQFIEIVKIETSDGRLHYACSLTLSKLQNIVHRKTGCFYNPYELLAEFWGDVPEAFRAMKVKIGNVSFRFKATRHLTVGQVVNQNQRRVFRLMDRRVSNGRLSFPLTRPHGSEWSYHSDIAFTKEIKKENWRLFLQAICGLYFQRVILMESARQRMDGIKRVRRLTAQRGPLVKGQCFDGDRFTTVAIGNNLLFTGRRQGRMIHVVDSPEYGRAMYVFNEQDHAHDWAARRIDFREARRRAIACIIHTGGWKNRANAVLVG